MTEAPPQQFQHLFDHAPDLMSIADVEGRILHANAAFTRLLGWSPDDITRASFLDFVHPNDVDHTVHRIAALAGDRDVVDLQNRCRTSDGSYRVIDWRITGRGSRVYAIGRDVTERVELADRVGQSEEYTRSVLDTVANGIITIDDRGTIQSVNRGVLRMFGYEPGELVGQNVSKLMPEPDRSRHDDYLARYLATGTAHVIGVGRQVTAKHRDGTTFPVHLSVDEFRSDGRTFFTGALQDLTEQTAVIEQLERARIASEAANLAKTEFLSRASHELRTPLHAIIGFAQLMEFDENADTEAVSTILSAGRHLLAVITDLLDVSRIEAGELPLTSERVRLREVLQECAAFVQPSEGSRIVLPEPDGVVVMADRQRLRQVVLNLLTNAVKYGGDAPVSVTVEALPDGFVRVDVRDRGPGIPDHLQTTVFAPFERLGKQTSGVEGSGLGLTVTERLVALMGGEIGVESVEGEGARFWFTVPSAP